MGAGRANVGRQRSAVDRPVGEVAMASGGSDDEAAQRRRALAALVLVVVLVIGSVWVFSALRREAQREDCLASHRRDCGDVEPGR